MVAKIRKQYRLAVEWLTEATLLAKVDGTVDISIVQAELMETIREVRPWIFIHGLMLSQGKN